MLVKPVFYTLSFFVCLFSVFQVNAEIYRCQAEQGGRVIFTDNKYACNLAAAKSIDVKPQALEIERKVLASIPDLSQRDPAAGFPDGGSKYCAPVAVSNSLTSAFPDVMGGLPNTQRFEQQVEIARTLGSAEYMATGKRGTNPVQLLKGVDHYLSDKHIPTYGTNDLEYRGQRTVPRKYNPTLDRNVELPWLIEGIKQEKHIWLNIGWYQADDVSGKQNRIGGHWVTLVGYEKLGSLKDSKGEYLMINDPATQGGKHQEKVTLKLTQFQGRVGYQLVDHRSKPQGADMAWVEGAIQLAL